MKECFELLAFLVWVKVVSLGRILTWCHIKIPNEVCYVCENSCRDKCWFQTSATLLTCQLSKRGRITLLMLTLSHQYVVHSFNKVIIVTGRVAEIDHCGPFAGCQFISVPYFNSNTIFYLFFFIS